MKLLDSPRCVVLQLVEECNLRCSMCYEWGETGAYHDKRELAVLDLEVARRVIEECAPAKPYFELFGGEPLLYPGLFDVIGWIRDAGCELAFPTNGTLLLPTSAASGNARYQLRLSAVSGFGHWSLGKPVNPARPASRCTIKNAVT